MRIQKDGQVESREERGEVEFAINPASTSVWNSPIWSLDQSTDWQALAEG